MTMTETLAKAHSQSAQDTNQLFVRVAEHLSDLLHKHKNVKSVSVREDKEGRCIFSVEFHHYLSNSITLKLSQSVQGIHITQEEDEMERLYDAPIGEGANAEIMKARREREFVPMAERWKAQFDGLTPTILTAACSDEKLRTELSKIKEVLSDHAEGKALKVDTPTPVGQRSTLGSGP